ncbi:TPR repeat family protein [Streptomyces sp. CBMAI 2042]|uniref:sel1 repeat family protein n=1 Tax=Streptomyces sp. CBMAI 2042 TaxID=2305222 RepID=UPI000F22A978|nr:sel1 repeat family protein [Streptomyces sp. CBMAI 2042]RLV67162.1 TPR repeat family protein [Streptomyces sp. CBMAI 2042]
MGVSEEREAPNDTAVGVGNSVSDGTFHAPVVQAGSVNGGVHTYYGQPHFSALPPVSEWPRLDAVDPISLGVRRTRRLPGESPLPPYVERDRDHELGARVGVAAQEGGLVVVTGAPLSGKTRTAWAALAGNLPPTTRIFAPPPGTDLRGLPAVIRGWGEQSCVLWLDDLEGHLGEHGLTPALLAHLVRLRVPVLATMDDEAYDAHRFGTSDRAGVLSRAEPFELPGVWSENELGLLRARPGDPRLTDAVIWSDACSLPEYLAVGPELMEEWRRAGRPNAHPRGHLLVRAAIDLARCSLTGVSENVLRRAQALYPQALDAAGTESFEDGLDWAADVRHGVTGLLTHRQERGGWSVFGSLVADTDARPESPPVPLGMWRLALDAAQGSDERWAVVFMADNSLTYRAHSDPESAVVLARINAEHGEIETAELWYRRAADTGHAEAAAGLAELLASRDAETEAIPYLEQAAEAGIVRAQYLLGMLLATRAQSWLTLAAESGHPLAARALPPLRKVTDSPPDTVKE